MSLEQNDHNLARKMFDPDFGNDIDEQTAAWEALWDLGDNVSQLRERAEKLGMFSAAVMFSIPFENRMQLRVYGSPITFPPLQVQDQFLDLTTNLVVFPDKNMSREGSILSSQYIVGPASLTVDLGSVSLEPKLFDIEHDCSPAVIWPDTDGNWELYRGSMEYRVPEIPAPWQQSLALETQAAQARILNMMLAQLTPGTEDARYAIE